LFLPGLSQRSTGVDFCAPRLQRSAHPDFVYEGIQLRVRHHSVKFSRYFALLLSLRNMTRVTETETQNIFVVLMANYFSLLLFLVF
jgi:hypothetical protein